MSELLYPEVETRLCKDEDALTPEQAKELLGWEVEKDDQKFPADRVHFKDGLRRAVHCANAVSFQRRFYGTQLTALFWEILAGNWEFNGKTVIIGQEGTVLDGKHRLAALVLAAEEWERNPERYPYWTTTPTVDVALLLGVRECSRVSNTIDSGKTRSLGDSIYASPLFKDYGKADKNRLSKVLEYAVRFLWERTGAKNDAYTPKLSHTDALDFVDRHPTLVDCVQAVFLEEGGKEKRLSRWLPLGTLAGLAYLMAVDGTKKAEEYAQAATPSESLLESPLPNYDQSDAFLAALGNEDDRLAALFASLKELDALGNTSTALRAALLCLSWTSYVNDKKPTLKSLQVKYRTEAGNVVLLDDYTIPGIDQGSC